MLPSAFTAITGRAHWEPLVRARAIENLCYVLAAGQGGYHVNGRATYGHSMIVDPWGTVLATVPDGGDLAFSHGVGLILPPQPGERPTVPGGIPRGRGQ